MAINGWRVMWVLAVFDTPVKTREHRRAYRKFRNNLLRNNFIQHQFSVYLRHCPTIASARALVARIRGSIPPSGHVAFYFLTDKQYGMTLEFSGNEHTEKRPQAPEQVELF